MENEQVSIPIQTVYSYRVAKQWRTFDIDFTSYITTMLAFPNYKIWIYYNNGKYQLWNSLEQKIISEQKIDDDIKFPTIMSNTELVYYDTKNQKLKLLNIENGQYIEKFKPDAPTQLALQNLVDNADKNDKVQTLINEGTKLLTLSESKLVVLLEIKSIISNTNENIITVWDIERQNASEILSQIVKDINQQKTLFITALNKTNTIMLWQQHFSDSPIEFIIWNVLQNKDQLKTIRLQKNMSCTIVIVLPIDETLLSIWLNQNSSGIPVMITVNWQTGEQINFIELNIYDPQNPDWILVDVNYYNNKKKIVVWQRCYPEGEYIDIYNPDNNKITFQSSVDKNCGLIQRDFSNDGKYYIEYEQQTHGDDIEDQKMSIEFTLNSIVSVRTSLFHFMEQKNLMKIYGKNCIKSVLDMLSSNLYTI